MTPRERIRGWKAIAGYLEVSLRQAQRLTPPVRTMHDEGRGSVFAWRDELDAWLCERPRHARNGRGAP